MVGVLASVTRGGEADTYACHGVGGGNRGDREGCDDMKGDTTPDLDSNLDAPSSGGLKTKGEDGRDGGDADAVPKDEVGEKINAGWSWREVAGKR